MKLISQHLPDVEARGDFENETATSLRELVQRLDPSGNSVVVIGTSMSRLFSHPLRCAIRSQRPRRIQVLTLRSAGR